jgi:glycosyltransferase involved in cell wall biosynthesis
MKKRQSIKIRPNLSPRLSAVVLTRNEERVLDRCLHSLDFCDEIVVIDSGSTDRTLEIAQRHNAKVRVYSDWPGFGEQRNRGLRDASGEWCLMIDADEWVSAELAAEISLAIGNESVSAYRIPRLSSYCGRFMRHGGWWPDFVTRLIRRKCASYEGSIHERCLVNGATKNLRHHLIHESFRNLEQVIEKMNMYSSLGAENLHARGQRPGLTSAVSHGLWTFLRTWLLRGGFLDGRHGFMLAISNAEGAYYKYVKAMLLSELGERVTPSSNPTPRSKNPFA